jgi:putative hydrolase of the HAD superfamily
MAHGRSQGSAIGGRHAPRRPGGAPCPPAAVLFDLYDTLVHAAPHSFFYRAVPSALGVSPERWLACYRALGRAAMLGEVPDMASRVHLACHDAGQSRDRDTVVAVVRDQLPLLYADIKADREALAALDDLRAEGVPLAIVSNAAHHSESLLDTFGFRDKVSATAMSWSVGALKPDPRIYSAALDTLGVPPGEAAFVGDGGDSELWGARRLGLRTILLERGLPHTDSARADADLCCTGLAEAVRVLLTGSGTAQRRGRR